MNIGCKARNRALGIALALALVLSMLPFSAVTAYAQSSGATIDLSDSGTESGTGWTYSETYIGGVFTVTGDVTVTGTTTTNRIVVQPGADVKITLSDARIEAGWDAAFDMEGATVDLELVGSNTLKSDRSAGLYVPSGATLTIVNPADDASNSLTAIGGSDGSGACAGIGGGMVADSGTITINGGIVTATGGGSTLSSAGIGGGADGAAGMITINGGTVTATGGNGTRTGAGIGGGAFGAGGMVTINGGTVTATGGNGTSGGAGIGGGSDAAGGTVVINGGKVIANSGACTVRGAGIGNGSGSGDSCTLYMNGDAMVFASSVSDASDSGKERGILFYGNIGKVYGDMELREDLTISQDKMFVVIENSTLTVPQGVTLTNEGTLVNNGTIHNGGTIDNSGKIINTGTIDGNAVIGAPVGEDVTPSVYNADDIAFINGIIDNNGLDWTKANPADGSYAPLDWLGGPSAWSGVRWSEEPTNKRITFMLIEDEPLTGALSVSGLAQLNELFIRGSQLAEITVSNMASLESLGCNDNSELAKLSVSGLTSLSSLNCGYNTSLTELSARGLESLESLDCSNSKLTSLDIDGLGSVKSINCQSNRLTKLDARGLTSLERLYCAGNKLAELNVSGLTQLSDLYCGSNKLTELDVSGLTQLSDLYCGNNRLAELKVSGAASLSDLRCGSNRLAKLDLSVLDQNLTRFYGNGQSVLLDMAGSGGSYNASVQMGEGTAISNSAVTYSNGTLTSTDNSAKNTEFTSPTGKPGTNLSGKLLLSYPDGDSTPIYNPGDIAVINALIENNGMVGTETELADGSYAPDDWGGVEWSAADTNKRVIGLRIDGQPIDGAYGEADVRGLAALERLDCYANKLTRLNVSGLASLQSIYCGNNRLASLDLSGLDALRELECYGNRLTALDLSGLDSLEDFYGNGQTASLTLYSNGGGYASRAAMGDGAAFGNSALSYDRSAGMLTSTNRKAGSSTFTSPTGQKDFALTGTLTLKYTDKTAPTADGVLDYRLEAQPGEGDITYNGDPRPILCGAKEGVVGLGTITVYYEGTSGTVYEKSDIPPANAGTYAVSVDIAEGDSYTAASGIQLGIYVIAKAPGTFPPLVNRTAVLKAALRLADIALPQGYAWDAPNTAITNIGNGQPFPATYTDPSGNYTAASGTVAVNVTDRETSTPGAVGTDIAKASVAVAGPAAWTGRQAKPKVTVKLGGRTLTAGKDYTVSYGANKNIGKGSVTVKGAGNYAGAKTAAFKILPQKVKLSKIKPAQKRIKVTWKKAKAAQKLTGYQIRYRAPGGKWKTKTVPAKKKELTIKGLAKGKKYRVQIRAYKKIGKEKYASPWSATKKSRRVR